MQRQSKTIPDHDDPGGEVAIHLAALRRFVSRRVADRDLVDDLVQESYARLLARSGSDAVHQPQAYLFRVASNLLADLHRREMASVPIQPIDVDDVPVRPEQEDATGLADLQGAFETALGELSPRCRDVFIMRRFDDLDTGTVAQRLGISHRMVQKHLNRAVTHLYIRLRGQPGEAP